MTYSLIDHYWPVLVAFSYIGFLGILVYLAVKDDL